MTTKVIIEQSKTADGERCVRTTTGEINGKWYPNEIKEYVAVKGSEVKQTEWHLSIGIRRVIFHNPATIVIWVDGSKTVVKVHNEPFDKEKGLAMAILKKLMGKAALRKEFKKWIKEGE